MQFYIRKPHLLQAVRWYPEMGNSIQDVYPKSDGQYAYINDGEIVMPGMWVIRQENELLCAYTDEEFQKLFEPAFPGYRE